jgi:uncharacterized protein YdaU (DUF1376 family)
MGLPYFPMYPDRWLSSSRIDIMSAEEERGYLRLLLRSWGMPDCTLPNDPSKLLKWSLMTDAEALHRHMQSMFELVDAGWRSPVLHAEWIKAKNKHEAMSKNASARWKRESNHAEALPKHMQKGDSAYNNQNQNHKKIRSMDKTPKSRFAPPTLKEVSDYCRERNNTVNPEKFIAHYTSNGWKVGKNPMKDWKAAIVSTWEKDNPPRSSGSGKEELMSALKNENNKTMPALGEEAKKLFYNIGVKWEDLQRTAIDEGSL